VHSLDPATCPVSSVLEFLLGHFLPVVPCPVFVAAIAAFQTHMGGESLGKHHLVSHFIRGTLRMRPMSQVRVPSWDLSITLEGLSLALFEPLELAANMCIDLKMVFPLAITSPKRLGDLQALSVASSCIEFSPV